MLGVSRETLAGMLREHGEEDLAERALTVSDDELARIGTLGAYYAFSGDAMSLGGSMGGSRALSLATIDVLESTGRDLRRSRTEWERQGSSLDAFADQDAVIDGELRRHAAVQQIPADESRRTLDLVWPAIDRLRSDSLGEQDDYPTDLLASLLRVDPAFWERSPDNDLELNTLAQAARERFNLPLEMRELIEAFNRDHADRRIALRARLSDGSSDDWWSWPVRKGT